jgi:hypothetical protein
MSEKLPISEFYKVVDQATIFRSEKWWEAIVLIESFWKTFYRHVFVAVSRRKMEKKAQVSVEKHGRMEQG